MHTFSKFNAYNMKACTHTHTHTHRVVYQGNKTEEKVFKKRKVFKEDLKELTMTDRNSTGRKKLIFKNHTQFVLRITFHCR